jgi:hypothetical protein
LKIPIIDIKSLRYQTRLASHVLVIEYQRDKIEVKQYSLIEFFNARTIKDFNQNLLHQNPIIQIHFDEGFEKFMQKKEFLHIKESKTLLGWIFFALCWFALFFCLSVLLLRYVV